MRYRFRTKLIAVLFTAVLALAGMGAVVYADGEISGDTWQNLQERIDNVEITDNTASEKGCGGMFSLWHLHVTTILV